MDLQGILTFFLLNALWMAILYLSLGVFYKKKNRGHLYAMGFVFGVIALVLILTFTLEVTESDGFCSDVCHPMNEYGESFEDAEDNTTLATHREEGVGCADCHNPPGVSGVVETKYAAVKEVTLYVTGQYPETLHHPEMEKKFCAKSGCHDETDWLIQGVETNETSDGMIEHPDVDEIEVCNDCHAPHQDGLKQKPEGCTVCHSNSIEDLTVEDLEDHEEFLLTDDAYLGIVTNISDAATCGDCHIDMEPVSYRSTAPNEFCGSCHDDEVTAFESGTVNQTAMYGGECADCHGEHKEKEELHPYSEEIECGVCHLTYDEGKTIHDLSSISYTNVSAELESEFCADCHTGEYTAFTENATEGQLDLYGDCSDCHTDHYEVRDIHPGLLEEIDCQNCHMNYDESIGGHDPRGISYGSEIDLVTNEFCSECHSGQFTAFFGNVTTEQVEIYGEECMDCHTDHDETKEIHSIPEDVDCWTCHLNYDDDIGAHDPSSVSYGSVSDQLDDEMCEVCHLDIYDAYYLDSDENAGRLKAYGDCIDCHSDHDVTSMPHSSAIEYQDCADCHTTYDDDIKAHTLNDADYGTMQLPNEFCGSCHEGILSSFGSGSIQGQNCVDCHESHEVKIATPQDNCGDCHANFRKTHDP